MSNKPKPASIRLLEGNPGHGHIPNTPKFRSADIQPPRGMKKIPKNIWNYLAPLLEPVGVLTQVDMPTFFILCSIFARWKETEVRIEKLEKEKNKLIEKMNEPSDDTKNEIIKLKILDSRSNEIMTLMRLSLNYAREWRMHACEFGITPSSRNRIETEGIKKTEADYLD